MLLLDRLEKSGHARRVRNPANRREQFVRVTLKEENVARRAVTERAKFYRTVFAPLDDTFIQAVFKSAKTILSFEAAAAKPFRRSS